jgi:hypothetical protein
LDPWFILLAAMGLLGLARLGARVPASRRPPGAAEPAGGNA